jgi:5-methylcytosine-specific restriction enzyme subunit McrC
MKQPIIVREYAQLEVGTVKQESLDKAFITQTDFDFLCSLEEEKAEKSQSFLRINGIKKLKVRNYVGIIETPNAIIEVLPKITEIEEPEQSRRILQKMLAFYLDLPERVANDAHLERYHYPLHEWLMKLFLEKLTILFKKGIRSDYERVEEEQPFLRGQFNIPARMRQPIGRQHIFPIRHDIYSLNRAENRLLKTAVGEVCRLTNDPENWRLSHEYHLLMQDIPRSNHYNHDFKQWRDGRLLAHYQDIRVICEIILTKFSPITTHGEHRGISLLFPMEKLFEKYVAAQVGRYLKSVFNLNLQVCSEYLCKDENFLLKPDMLIKQGDENKLVLDTKWKRLDKGKESITQSDVYQMFAYSQKFACDVVLIYPQCEKLKNDFIFKFFDGKELQVVLFDLTNDVFIFTSNNTSNLVPFLSESYMIKMSSY